MSKVHDLINQERRKRGIRTVYWSREMARLAQSQANYCARAGHLIHSNRFAYRGGENLAQGGRYFPPRAIVNCWLKSNAGHREYLLSPRVQKAGVGISKSRGKTYAAWAFSDKSPNYPDCPYYKPQRPKIVRRKIRTNSHIIQLLLVLVSIILLVDSARRVYLLISYQANPAIEVIIFAMEFAVSLWLIKYAKRL
jgi:hypothetical protein